MHLEVKLRFCHLHLRQVHLSVRDRDWLRSRRIAYSDMENDENLFKKQRNKTYKSSVYSRGNDIMLNKR